MKFSKKDLLKVIAQELEKTDRRLIFRLSNESLRCIWTSMAIHFLEADAYSEHTNIFLLVTDGQYHSARIEISPDPNKDLIRDILDVFYRHLLRRPSMYIHITRIVAFKSTKIRNKNAGTRKILVEAKNKDQLSGFIFIDHKYNNAESETSWTTSNPLLFYNDKPLNPIELQNIIFHMLPKKSFGNNNLLKGQEFNLSYKQIGVNDCGLTEWGMFVES